MQPMKDDGSTRTGMSNESQGITTSVSPSPAESSPSRGISSAEEELHCPGNGDQIPVSTPSAQPSLPHPVPTLSAQPCPPHSGHHEVDVMSMVRNRGNGPAPRSALVASRPDHERRSADVREQQERQPRLDIGARHTLSARTSETSRSSSSSSSSSSKVPTPVAFNVMTMVRNRGRASPPPRPPPQRSASVEDRPSSELLARGPTDANRRQELQPALDGHAGVCDTAGVPCGSSSGSGNALIDCSAVQAVGGSGLGCTRTPDRTAATAADRRVQGGRGALSDQLPSFDAMSMVRDRGSEPAPPLPPSPRSTSTTATVVDRPKGEPLAREPADVNERPESQPPLGVDAGACDTSEVSFGGSGNASIDSAVLASTGVGGNSRGCTQDRGAATAADRGLPGGRAAVSNQSLSFDVMAMVRNHGSEPTPPTLVVGRSQGATSTGRGFVGSGPLDTAGLGLNKNCYFCGRQSKRVRTEFKALWVCEKKCGRWACGATKCFSDAANCCSCDGDAAVGCRCFNCERKRKRKKARVNHADHNGDLTASRPANKVARRTASWNSFVLPPTLAERDDSAAVSVYSVCGTRQGSRALVVTNGQHAMCTRDECKGLGTGAASANEKGGRSVMKPCEHGEAAEKTRAQRPTSVRFHAEADLRALALDLADKGVVGDHEVDRIQGMYRAACDSGVPLVAKLGDTGYYVVRDGGVDDDDRPFPAGWAHVLYDREAGADAAARNGRRADDGEVVCKAFNGRGCFQAERGRKVCMHTHVVRIAALVAQGPGCGDAAAGAGTRSLTSVDGGGDHSDDEIFASARWEFENNSPSFVRKMSQLMKISAVYLIPPNPLEHLPRDGPLLAERFTCFEKSCTLCGVRYEEMADQSAVAVTQGWTGVVMRRVSVEIRECSTCGAQAWASDNWRTTGMFNFNNKLLVDIRILVGARGFHTRGLPLEEIFEQILVELKGNIGWLEKNPELTLRLTNRDLGQQLKDCYLAFEATTDHPGDHSSILDGHFPRLHACDGSNKLVTDNMHMDMLLQARQEARQETFIDMDLGAQQLKFSMMTPMVFGTRFQFMTKTPVNFTPNNRKSNIFRLRACKAAPIPGSVESGDGAQLLEYLRNSGRGVQALDDMAKTELDNIYVRVFGGSSGLDRYSTKALLVELFQKLRAHFVGLAGGSGECSEFLLGRGSAATSGVEGFFTPDGVQIAHMFLWRAEGPNYVVDMVNHFLVPPIVLVTDTPCTVRPIMEQRCGHLLENGGILPRIGPSGDINTTDSEGVATGLDDMQKPPPVELRDVSIPTLVEMGINTNPIAGSENVIEEIDVQHGVGEIELQQHDEAAVADVYELFRRASASSPAQRGLDFSCLFDVAARESPDDWAVGLRSTVVDSWEQMHERGYYFLSLFEAALVEMECYRLTAVRLRASQHTSTGNGGEVRRGRRGRGGGTANGVEGRRNFSDLPTGTKGVGGGGGLEAEGGSCGGREEESSGDVLHWRDFEKREQFLRKVLATAVGATKLSGAPTLPGFSVGALVPDLPLPSIGGLDALLKYGEAKVKFIADGLKPDSGRLKAKAVHFLRGGVGFGTPVHAVKSLQIALAGCNPGESASEEGLVKGYSLPFNIKPPELDQVRKPHPIVGKVAGLHLSAGGPHEGKKHGPKCRARFGGLETCEKIAGVNLNPHEQNQAKKKWRLPSLNVMSCDAFAFMVTLGNELDNQSANRRSLDRLVKKHSNHPKEHEVACQMSMWNCGRCFCSRPLMRRFDRFGRVAVTFLDKELIL